MSRKPTSNEIFSSPPNPWGANELEDDFFLLTNGKALKCIPCGRVVRKCYLQDGICPDCYKKQKGVVSPAIARVEKEKRRSYNWGASGEDGEAD